MKKFIVLPILVPSILVPSLVFCNDDDSAFDVEGIELNVPGTVSQETKSPHGYMDDKGYDDFLQRPPVQSTEASGTTTDEDGDDQYESGLYGEQYDDQDLDDSVYDRDDSVIR